MIAYIADSSPAIMADLSQPPMEAAVHTARPEHAKNVFEGCVILETGQLSLLRHGLTLFQRGIER